MLVKIGFKHIEIGFLQHLKLTLTLLKLIEENLIPEDVYIEVLVQARDHLIANVPLSLWLVQNVRLCISTIQTHQHSVKSVECRCKRRKTTCH